MAKKLNKNLSDLLKKYNITDDVSDKKQYGLGSFLQDNAVGILQTGAGAALTATGAGAAAGVPLMASGVGSIASNELAKTDPEAALAAQQAAGVAGTVGSVLATPQAELAHGGPMSYNDGGMVNKGLTEYNGGGTHEENPNGGIDVGANAQVEDKETRWEDYIFSDRLDVPGKKYSFSEASKKINDKYSKRKNDSFDKKAIAREMSALMAMQEGERERMDLDHRNKMSETFAMGGKKDSYQEGGVLPADPETGGLNIAPLTGRQVAEAPGRLSPDRMNPATPTSLDQWEELNYSPTTGALQIPLSVGKEFDEREKRLVEARGKIMSGYDMGRGNIPAGTKISQQDVLDKGILNKPQMYQYLEDLDWKNRYYQKQGADPINYAGSIEGSDIPLSEQALGRLHLGAREAGRRPEMFRPEMRGLTAPAAPDPNVYKYGGKKIDGTDEKGKGQGNAGQYAPMILPDITLPSDNTRTNVPQQIQEGNIQQMIDAAAAYQAQLDMLNSPYTAIAVPDYNSTFPNDSVRYFPGQMGPQGVPYIKDLGNLAGVSGRNSAQDFIDIVNSGKGRMYQDTSAVRANPKMMRNEPNYKYGGKVKAQFGLDLGQLQAAEEATRFPNLGVLNQYAGPQGSPVGTNYRNAPEDTGYLPGEGVLRNDLPQLNQYASYMPQEEGRRDGESNFGKYAALAGQNLGNIYNLAQGLQGAKQEDLGQINPRMVNLSAAIRDVGETFDTAGSIGRENIRRSATSSGQALSNLIAQNTGLARGRGKALADIASQEELANVDITNRAEQANLALRNQSADLTAQNEAAKQRALSAGLSGIGETAARFRRDERAESKQQGYIENLLRTGEYHIGKGGQIIHTASGQPVQ